MFRDRDGWRVQWREPGGRRRSKSFTCPKAARRFELELEVGTADKSPSERLSPTFEAFARRWLAEYSRAEKRATSHDEDSRVVRCYLTPAFGPRRLTTLRQADLVELKGRLLTNPARKGRPLSPKSVNNYLMIAKTILGYAVELDLLPANPWAKVKPCKLSQREFDYWLPAEREAFWERASRERFELAALAYLACHTGLRKGELAALTWTAVDFGRRKVRVAASYATQLKVHSATKGGEVADVPLNEAALGVLRRLAERKTGATVFRTDLFGNLRRDFQALAKRVGVRRIRWHDTRHTFGSCLAMAGVDLLVIQQLMRHKSYEMTLRYAHLHPSHLAGATEVLCGTQTARKAGRHAAERANPATSQRAQKDSNLRPPGSKPEYKCNTVQAS